MKQNAFSSFIASTQPNISLNEVTLRKAEEAALQQTNCIDAASFCMPPTKPEGDEER